jgi:hypothetical protein
VCLGEGMHDGGGAGHMQMWQGGGGAVACMMDSAGCPAPSYLALCRLQA